METPGLFHCARGFLQAIDWTGLLLFAAVMVGTPGPANMVMMASGAAFGARASLPLLAGVILGKQVIIWPLGLGIMGGLDASGPVFQALRWASVAYILYLAWRIAGSRIVRAEAGATPPGFVSGLVVHPLNPKAWAMIVGVFTTFVGPAGDPIAVTLTAALAFLGLQLVAQPLWMLAGVEIARHVAGTAREVWLLRGLALVMLASLAWAVLGGMP